MPSSKTQISQNHVSEIYGQVIGLYGDPTNQDTVAGGVTMSSVFDSYITWSGSTLQKTLFWSRVLICVILNPFDTTFKRARIALVLKPRALWLFNKGGNVADYVGHEASIGSVGTANADGVITSVNPGYNFGDLIRIAVLPSALDISNWTDNFTALYSEYYDAAASLTRSPALAVSGMTIKASTYIPSIADFTVSKIVYYDKNVDARTRIVGGSGSSVTVPFCIGGVTALYSIKGTRIG